MLDAQAADRARHLADVRELATDEHVLVEPRQSQDGLAFRPLNHKIAIHDEGRGVTWRPHARTYRGTPGKEAECEGFFKRMVVT
jgi:hypothetical protein